MAPFRKDPSPGDLIEIFHKDGDHWAIFVGDGAVVHLAPQGDRSLNSPFLNGKKVVKQNPLKDVVGSSRYKVNNHLDKQCPALPADEILRRVEDKIGAEMENSVGDKELFTHLRHGVAYSKEFYKSPHTGDLIEIFHKDYTQWAVYVGSCAVVHLAPQGKKVVKKKPLKEVVGSSPYKVNNHLDNQCPPLAKDEFIQGWKEKIGAEIENSVLDKEFVTHLRYGVVYSKKFFKEPTPGDLIEIFCIHDEHWAFYMGDGVVIHLTPTRDKLPKWRSFQSSRKVVKQEPLKDVVSSFPYRVNNYLDGRCPLLPEKEIRRKVEEMIDIEMDNRVGNKEFVTHLRYGVAYSEQFYKSLHPGDLIEIFHKDNTQWAVYVENFAVVHLAPQGDRSLNSPTFLNGKKVVKQKPLKEVVGSSPYKVNNHLDGRCPALSEDEIVSQAKKKTDSDMGNSVLDKGFVTHLRYGVAHGMEFYVEPSPGDLIEIFRSDNHHWALYVGDGDVVHLVPHGTRPTSVLLAVKSRVTVKQEPLKDVVGVCYYKISNYLDEEYRPLPISQILRAAKDKVGQEMEYSAVGSSRKFFTQLRYGKSYSPWIP